MLHQYEETNTVMLLDEEITGAPENRLRMSAAFNGVRPRRAPALREPEHGYDGDGNVRSAQETVITNFSFFSPSRVFWLNEV